MRKRQGTICVAISLFVLAAIAYLVLGTMVSKHDLTVTRMTMIARQLNSYAQNHGAYPDTLSYVAERELDDTLTDAWGRKILYSRNSKGDVTLRSYGRDGQLGGRGEDADIERTETLGGTNTTDVIGQSE